MSQPSVLRLKELLFEQEAREIDALAARVGTLAEAERRQMVELARRIDDLYARAGGDAELRASVSRIIDGALHDAEVSRHRELADAMAPVVVRTVRAELVAPATQDQIAGSLYKKIGEMVRRYVASAMRDLMEGINRRLEAGLSNNRLMLKLRSIATGRSMAELALSDTQRLAVEEVYLIKRGSGELIQHWEHTPDDGDAPLAGANRDTLISGFLTAITAFAEEAFVADKASLRALDLDDHRIYLRGSPSHLVAAKCRGAAPGEIEALLDAELIRLLNEHGAIEDRVTSGELSATGAPIDRERERLLEALAERIEAGVAERSEAIRQSRGGVRPVKVLLWLIGLPLLGLALWQAWVTYETRNVQAAADEAVASIGELSGYPVSVRVERGGNALWAVGLTPNEVVRETLRQKLKALGSHVQITDTLGILPQTDVDGAVKAASLSNGLGRAEQRLKRLAQDLLLAAGRLGDSSAAPVLQAGAGEAARSAAEIGKLSGTDGTVKVEELVGIAITKLEAVQVRLHSLAGPTPPEGASLQTAGPSPIVGSRSVTSDLDRLGLVAETLAQLAVVVEQRQMAAEAQAKAMAPLRQQIEELSRRLESMRPVATPRQLLEDFIRRNAVFFGNGVEYRDAAGTAAILDELAGLARQAGSLLRIVGYTDDAGAGPRNVQLSQQRADAVLEELVRRGVERGSLIAVGRATALDLAPRAGANSANRRVQFEIGFNGEDADRP